MTTTSQFLTVSQNLARYQTMTNAEPAVKTASQYYAANIGKVTSAAGLVGNYRLLSYALDAFGLGSFINDKALITQVINGGVTSHKALANTLNDSRWFAFAKAFDFTQKGAASVTSPKAAAITTKAYVESQLESDQGQQDPGVQLALYFQRIAPTVTSAYGILADPNLLNVVQTVFGLPPVVGSTNIDQQANTISKLVPLSILSDPKKLQNLTERFTAMYELTYGPTSNNPNGLSVASNDSSNAASGASAVLSGIISSNGDALAGLNSSGASMFSNQLLLSLQGLQLGGL